MLELSPSPVLSGVWLKTAPVRLRATESLQPAAGEERGRGDPGWWKSGVQQTWCWWCCVWKCCIFIRMHLMGLFVMGWCLLHQLIWCFTEQHLLAFVCIYFSVLPVWSWLTLQCCVVWEMEQSAEVQNSGRTSSRLVFSPTCRTEFIPQPCHFKILHSPKLIQEQLVQLVLIYRTTCLPAAAHSWKPGGCFSPSPRFKIITMLWGCSQLRPERPDSIQCLTCVASQWFLHWKHMYMDHDSFMDLFCIIWLLYFVPKPQIVNTA